MNDILVVGGAGYVGGIVVDYLLKSPGLTTNYITPPPNIIVYDNLLYEDSYRKPGVDFVCGDIRDTNKLKPLLDKSAVVIWLAAIVGDGACQINPSLTKEINTDTVKWLSENYNGKIIFTSTCSVYGAQDKELDETSLTNPLSAYAVSKLEAEKYLENKNSLIFRLGTLFGVGDLFSRIRLDLVVNTLTVKAHTIGVIDIFGGEQFRPLLHVKDVAATIVENINKNVTGVFNLHMQNIKIIDLAYQVKNHFPELMINHTDMPFQDTRNYRVSSDKATANLKFNPTHTIDQGIVELKYLIKTNRIKDLDNKRYSNQEYLNSLNTNQR